MKKKCGIIIGLFLLLTIFYFEYSVTILWDSAHYMSYVNIFERVLPWNSWDVVRGPIFPLVIYFGNLLFGKTSQGLIMNTHIYFLVMLLFSYRLLVYFFDKISISKKKRNVLTGIIILTVIINPIIYGFYHSLLTEFVAITISVVSCYLAILWLDCDYCKDTKKYILLSFIFTILTIVSWFLKQPYVSCALFVLVVACFISIFQVRKLKNFIVRFSTLLVCVIFLIISIQGWNIFLKKVGNDPNTDRNPTNSLGNQLITAIDFLRIDNDADEVESIQYINYSKLNDKEKKEVKKLLKKNKEYLIINYYEGKKVTEADYLVCDDGNVSTGAALKYIISVFVRHPVKVMDSYVTNYLSIIDVYSTSTEDGVGYYSNKKVDLLFSSEIVTIGFRPYSYGTSNIFYMFPEMYERVQYYEQPNYAFKGLNVIMRFLGKIFLLLFKLLFLLLPFLLVASVIMRIHYRKDISHRKVLNLIIIFFGFSFLHIMLHTVTGAIIDRYAVPVFLPVFIGTFMFCYFTLNQKMTKHK